MSIPNPYLVTAQLEVALSEYAGSKYCVAVESCSAAILLSLFWFKQKGPLQAITIPKFTYNSVPCSIIIMGGKVKFSDEDWHGTYRLDPYPIVDGALRFRRGMYEKGTLHCISGHIKKILNVGRLGAILTDDLDAYEWLRRARFDGRNPMPLNQDNFQQLGLNVYLDPALASRALQIMQVIGDKEIPDLEVSKQGYADLSLFKIYTQ